MSTPSHRLSLSEIMQELGSILRTPIPGAEFLDSVIPIQRLFDRGTKQKREEVPGSVRRRPVGKRAPNNFLEPRNFMSQGLLRRNPGGEFFVGNETVEIDEATWIFGELEIGAFVIASGEISSDGKRCVKKLIVKTINPTA